MRHNQNVLPRMLARGKVFTSSHGCSCKFATSRLYSIFCSTLLAFLAIFGSHTQAATIKPISLSGRDVAAAVSSATEGDIVQLPVGTAIWTNTLVVSKAITLQGAGIGKTIIQDSIDSAGNGNIIIFNAVAAKKGRLTGVEFQNGNRSAASYSGSIVLSGLNTDGGTLRLDHCKFDRLLNFSVMVYGAIGVIDHCEFAFDTSRIGIYVFHQNWDGKSFGDGSWAAASDWNGTNWLVVEDCSFNNSGALYAVIDSYRGARWIFRHNSVTNGWCEAHGTESGQRFRGTRAIQVYNNVFDNRIFGFDKFVNLRSGTALICSNTALGNFTASAVLACYRAYWQFTPWGGANGTNFWDSNLATLPYASGTHSGAAAATSLTDNTKNWTPNQWAGYTIQNLASGRHSYIISNSPTTITYTGAGGYGPTMTFNSGDRYQVWKVNEAIDQPGKGQGTLLAADPPTLLKLTQTNDPVYEWANSLNGKPGGLAPQVSFIRSGEHYFENTPKQGFTPMAYPHPLVTGTTVGTVTSPIPPNGLRIAAP